MSKQRENSYKRFNESGIEDNAWNWHIWKRAFDAGVAYKAAGLQEENVLNGMKAELLHISEDIHTIRWDDGNGQFGEVQFEWNSELGRYTVDTEMLDVETLIKIIKAL